MITRPAGADDVKKVNTFFLEAWKKAGPGALGFAGATDESIQKIASEEFLRVLLSDPAKWLFVAEEDHRIIGFASLRENEEDKEKIELSGIIVLSGYEGKGIGTSLYQEALRTAKDLGFRRMVVKTETFNERAIGFYKKLGFIERGTKVETIDGTNVSLVVLEAILPTTAEVFQQAYSHS